MFWHRGFFLFIGLVSILLLHTTDGTCSCEFVIRTPRISAFVMRKKQIENPDTQLLLSAKTIQKHPKCLCLYTIQ